jgi:hypothetical protein
VKPMISRVPPLAFLSVLPDMAAAARGQPRKGRYGVIMAVRHESGK